ncbi:PKD domain-containing protein [Thalassotalea sp. G2M2-11]|uniref:PKD domain-containing protein n=1 Tax=Thalassotalea sp. G2M2-11 TaxID=2787627 RepID=UPI001F493BFA|nr:PKD domain-containing protein [Thalassotalea sp. G2M2-11]
MFSSRYVLKPLLLSTMISAPLTAMAQPEALEAQPLFTHPTFSVLPSKHGVSAVRGKLNAQAVANGTQQIQLTLPNGKTIEVQRHNNRGQLNNASWHGKVMGRKDSDVSLTIYKGLVFGRIGLGQDTYEIRSQGGYTVVEQLDTESFPDCDSSIHDFNTTNNFVVQNEAAANEEDGTVIIDLLSVYTQDAIDGAGGVAEVNALIQAAIDVANTAFVNSQVNAEYRLVHTELVNYDGTQSTTRDARDWAANNPQVQALRDQYSADMVSIVLDTPSSCGTAYIQRQPGPDFAPLAYQATDIDCAVGNMTFSHEHGHNLGMEHNPENTSATSDTASFAYSFGLYHDGNYRTTMSYSSPCNNGCSRVAYFSNPDVVYNGKPTGVANKHNNAQTAKNTTPIIEQFRASVPPSGDPNAQFDTNVSGLTVNFTDLSYDADGTIQSWLWDFGDGTSSSEQHPQHSYLDNGTYTVSLTVTDNDSITDTATQSLTVMAQAPDSPSNLLANYTYTGKGKDKTITEVVLVWNDNSGNETGFELERCFETVSGKGKKQTVTCDYSLYQTLTANTQSTSVSNEPGWRYRVRAVNNNGASDYSNSVIVD